jgi:hypothetical protein
LKQPQDKPSQVGGAIFFPLDPAAKAVFFFGRSANLKKSEPNVGEIGGW